MRRNKWDVLELDNLKIYRIEKLIHSPKVQDWCRLKYPGHPNGCPNYDKAKKCPPQCKYITEVFDLSKPLYFVHSEFDLAGHVLKMKKKHPNWSDRQARCVLYWQNTSRKQLMARAMEARRHLGCKTFTLMPEALGVNVYVTAKLAGLKLEPIRKLKTCRHVALLGDTI